MTELGGVGAVGQNPFENFDWLSKADGPEETGGVLAGKEPEETGGVLAGKEPNLFDGMYPTGADNSLFANNDKNIEQEEASGQLAGAGFCMMA